MSVSSVKETRPLYRNCVVFTHCSLYKAQKRLTANPVNDELLVVMDLLTKYNVNMVVSGHEHYKDVSKLGNTTYIISDSMSDTNGNASYLKLTVKNGVIEYQFVEV